MSNISGAKTVESILEYRFSLARQQDTNWDMAEEIKQAKQDLLRILESKLPKEKVFGKDYDEDSNCDFNYVQGYNLALADCKKVLLEVFDVK